MIINESSTAGVVSRRSLSGRIRARHELNRLCSEAVAQQVERGEAEATHLRNRRRYLAKQILKCVPHAGRLSPKKLLHAATMVLAMWGFAGMAMPVQAMPLFKHVTLEGFDTGSYTAPVFADIDGDGDLDAFVGESLGTVKFYRNTGSNTMASFVADVAENPLTGFDVGSKATPTFADIDGDGDLDAFVGSSLSVIKFYRNTGTRTAPVFVADAINNPLSGINIGGGFYIDAAPAFADIDGDGDLDVFIGDNYGTLKFYRNTGTALVPTFVADIPGNPLTGMRIVFNDPVAPVFSDIDGDGDLDAFIGDGKSATVKFYRNNGTNIVPNFVRDIAGNPLSIVSGRNAPKPSFADIDNDGDFDVFVGFVDGVTMYQNAGNTTSPGFVRRPAPFAGFKVQSFGAAPTFADIDNDGDLDAIIGEYSFGAVHLSSNTGTAMRPSFVSTPVYLFGAGGGNNGKPVLADIDNDGDLDAFVGSSTGSIVFFRNTGTSAASNFVRDIMGNPLSNINVITSGLTRGAALAFADIDNDGDLDAFVGELGGTIRFYRNNGSASMPGFIADVLGNPLAGFDVGSRAAPVFADIDQDGDLDAFVGETLGPIKFFRNTGTVSTPVFVPDMAGNPLAGFDVGFSAVPAFADIDHDGDSDVFIGNDNGRVKFFENFDIRPVAVADNVTTTAAHPVTTTNVMANDHFKSGAPAANFTISTFTQGANGAVVRVAGTNTFTYTPNAGFTGADTFTYTLNDGAGNTATGTVNVMVNAPVASTFGLNLNAAAFNSTTNKMMILNATTVTSIPPTHADVYVALQLPDGTLLAMQPNGSFSTALTPLVANISVPDFNGPIFNYTFNGTESSGTYTWFAALTTPGTLNVIGTLATASFTFVP